MRSFASRPHATSRALAGLTIGAVAYTNSGRFFAQPGRTGNAWETLRVWLEDGGAKGIEAIELAESQIGDGYGLLARRAFSQSEMVVTFPRVLCLAAEDVDHVDLEPPEERLAAALLREKHLGEKSKFKAYIDYLLTSPSTHPASWPSSSRDWKMYFVASPGAMRRIRLARMRAAAAVARMRLKGWQEEAVRWALAVVGSRAFPDGSREVMLCPLLDLLNHHPPSQSGGPACGYLRLGNSVGMVAERDIQANEELCHLYALSPSSALFARYGFVPRGGMGGFEESVLEVHTAIGDLHRAALARRGLRACPNQPLLLRLFGNIGSSLILPVARLLTVPSEDLPTLEVEILQLGQELTDPQLELKACALAEGWLDAQNQRISANLKCLDKEFDIQRAAVELLLAEGKLIKAAIDWLQQRQRFVSSKSESKGHW